MSERPHPDTGHSKRVEPARSAVVTALGITEIFAWGCSYYLPTIVAKPIAEGTGWSLAWVVGGLSLGLVVAGAISPIVGLSIHRRGGRPVLIASAIFFAIGLSVIALSQNIEAYLAGWIMIGLGMGAGLYDAAFATLGRMYREGARSAISLLTLFGGFSSTVCWPLSWSLVETTGWRVTCLVYAAMQLVMSLPIYLLLLPATTGSASETRNTEIAATTGVVPQRRKDVLLFSLVAAIITFSAVIQSIISVHLLNILQKRAIPLTNAVVLGAFVGPSQVSGRLVEITFGRRFHPIWTMMTSAVLVVCGLGLMSVGAPVIALGLVLHGAGMGIMSIARGTVPLALFGPIEYPVVMGRLAAPSLLAQAISPLIGAVVLESAGASHALLALSGIALLNLILISALALQTARLRGFFARSKEFHAFSNQ
jgi:MFS family permease